MNYLTQISKIFCLNGKVNYLFFILFLFLNIGCMSTKKNFNFQKNKTLQLLSDSGNKAICYGGYRLKDRAVVPTRQQQFEDLKIMAAMGVKFIRTYNVHLPEAAQLLECIKELKAQDNNFEMNVMLGAWIDCKNAWTNMPVDHDEESDENKVEIAKAVELTRKYPDIVKIISVGNEAMVKWATAYYVQPRFILKWVNHLQDLKKQSDLSQDLLITSSDNFASWGGGDAEYHNHDLEQLIRAVDYISMHTYPMHDTHYNPSFWGLEGINYEKNKEQQTRMLMKQALDYAVSQYNSVKKYVDKIAKNKPIHIGETGWATMDHDKYGNKGSKATDEFKSGMYYDLITKWCQQNNMACFYFEAFDEHWKDSYNAQGSENHFGLFTMDGKAKYALWDMVDQGKFKGLSRDGYAITKSLNGDKQALLEKIELPLRTQKMQKATTNN